MILVDTSVWVDYFRGNESAQAGRLVSALEADEDLCICGIILTEILQGITSRKQREKVVRLLDTVIYLPAPREVHELAADIYARVRAGGRIIRNTVDCIIAACAIVHGIPLLQRDRDFQIIAEVSELKLERCG